jgi:hypothetical protein
MPHRLFDGVAEAITAAIVCSCRSSIFVSYAGCFFVEWWRSPSGQLKVRLRQPSVDATQMNRRNSSFALPYPGLTPQRFNFRVHDTSFT